MKIVICGSMSSAEKMIEIKNDLQGLGHEVILPRNTENYASGEVVLEDSGESTENKIKYDLIREYYREINESDAVLIVNVNKNGIDNYIGGNAFLELGFGHVLNKKIYLLNPIPTMIYVDEIMAMQPIILNNDFSRIK